MKRFRFGWIAVALIVLIGFGCADEKLSSGTFRLSQISYSPQDECNVKKNIVEDHEIDVTVKDGRIRIYMVKDLTPPEGTIIGGSFMAFSTRNGDVIPNTDCRDMWIKKVTGKLVRKNVFTGTYEFTDKALSGNDCADGEKIGFHPPLCTSTVTFTATKK